MPLKKGKKTDTIKWKCEQCDWKGNTREADKHMLQNFGTHTPVREEAEE